MADRAPLSPAESLLLLNPREPAREMVKTTFLSLLAQNVLRIETKEKRRSWGTEKVQYVHVMVPQVPNAPSHVASLIDALKSDQPDGMTMTEAVKCMRLRYGIHLDRFRTDYILPSLVRRGLMHKRFGLFYRRTAAGEAERNRIAADVEQARQIPGLLKSNPAQAAAVALAVGSTVLLVGQLRDHYGEIGAEMRRNRGEVESGAYYSGLGGPSGAPLTDLRDRHNGDGKVDGKVDVGAVDLSTFDLASFDASTLGALDAGMTSFDTGFSGGDFGGGADGGGGGGGGDGGGA